MQAPRLSCGATRDGLCYKGRIALHLWWTVVDSAHGPTLRLAHDRLGTRLLPTPDEDRLRLAAELAEERKARTLAEHERMLAEQALREQSEARERERVAATAEIERLKEELARARGQRG